IGTSIWGNSMAPLVPTKIEPWRGSIAGSTKTRTAAGGRASPSYQVRGRELPSVCGVPGKRSLTMVFTPQLCWLGAGLSERTVSGADSPSAPKTGSRMWQPISPKVAVPKSIRLRQLSGWYHPSIYGRGVATPSHCSQLRLPGTASERLGIGSGSPHLLSLQEGHSFTLTIATPRTKEI